MRASLCWTTLIPPDGCVDLINNPTAVYYASFFIPATAFKGRSKL